MRDAQPLHGRQTRRVAVLGVLAALPLTLLGCDSGTPSPSPGIACPGPLRAEMSAADVLQAGQRAVDCGRGYEVTVHGHNLVLPLWGGIDDAHVAIDAQSGAKASVQRTGDGRYSLLYVGGETFFRRDTCGHWARRSGGGRDVLAPFLWSERHTLERATHATVVSRDPGRFEVSAELPYLGTALITLDTATARPLSLAAQPTGGTRTNWTFSAWNDVVTVTPLPGPAPDQGPGGNPC